MLLKQFTKIFEDNGEEFDPQEDQNDDEDEDDFSVEEDVPLSCRAKMKNWKQSHLLERMRAESTRIGKAPVLEVRGRILTTYGIDPTILLLFC
ncbi:hypothetical protein R1flu_010442 [Riccia fluitans]|uniref:Uncharacterized protein n=1 Tax=Riccia fluitans TaxID=41844 RepID=A0ABD1Z506_9MARC